MANPFDRFDVNPFDQFDQPLPETPIAPAEPTLGSSVLGGMVAPVLPETAPVSIMPRDRRVNVGLGDVLQAPAMPVTEGAPASSLLDRFANVIGQGMAGQGEAAVASGQSAVDIVDATGKALTNVPENLAMGGGGLLTAFGDKSLETSEVSMARMLETVTDPNWQLDPNRITPDEQDFITWADRAGLLPEDVERGRFGQVLADQNLSGVMKSIASEITPDKTTSMYPVFEEAPSQMRSVGMDIIEGARETLVDTGAERGTPEYYISQGISSLAEMAPAMVASAVTRSPIPMATFMGGYSGGRAYVDAIEGGAEPKTARLYGTLNALAEGAGEAIPVSIILKAGKNPFSRFLKGAAAEGIQESATELMNIGLDMGILDRDMTFGEAFARTLDSGIIGTVAGGGLSLTAGGVEKAMQGASRMMQQQPPEAAPAIGDVLTQRLEAMRAEAEAPIQPRAQPAPEAPTVPVQPVAPPQVGIAPEVPTVAPQAPVAPSEAVPVVTPTPTAAPEAQAAPTMPEAPTVPAPAPTVDTDAQAPQAPVSQAQEPVVVPTEEAPVAAPDVPEKPTAPTTPEFKAWFGKSKVVDPKGEPLILYHGTSVEPDTFRTDRGEGGELGAGAYFTDSEQQAETYADAASHREDSDGSKVVVPVYVALQNPFYASDTESIPSQAELIKQGYDGIIDIGNLRLRGDSTTSPIVGKANRNQYVAFYPEQIQKVADVSAQKTPTPTELPIKPETAVPEAVSTQKQANAALPEGIRAVRRNTENPSEWTLLGDNAEVIGTFTSTSPDGIDAATLSDMQRAERPRRAEETHPAVQNEDGSPKTLYHGTSETFEEFQAPTRKEGEHEFRSDRDIGVFLTSDPEAASYYAAEGGRDTRNIRPVKVQMTNPFIYDYKGAKKDSTLNRRLADKAKAAGHDGLILQNVKDTPQLTNLTEDVYVAFDPAQVSSVFEKKPAAAKKKAPVLKEVAEVEEVTTTKLKDTDETVGRRPKGKLAPSFLKFSFTNRPSVFGAAFRDAGIDPSQAKLMPIEKQIKILADMLKKTFGVQIEMPTTTVRKKNIAGRMVETERQSITTREAVDQMLDAYRQLQMLASIMGLPKSAIGLQIDGKGIVISLVSKKKLRGALGMFSFTGKTDNRTIHLPGRSNSFAHEWAHSLDHFMNHIVDPKDMVGLLSRRMDVEGLPPMNSANEAITEAFASIMWSMYGDSMQLGALQTKLEVETAQVGKDGNPTPKAKRATKILSDMKAGRRPPAEYLSAYFDSSKQYDDMMGQDGYFTDPAEMFARAFEAWVGITVSSNSDLPQSFLSKGDWAYAGSEDTRNVMTFPKDTDAAQFAIAMASLSSAMQQESLFPGDKAPTPNDADLYSGMNLLRFGKADKMGESEISALRRSVSTLRGALKITVAWDVLKSFARGVRFVYQQVGNSTKAAMFAVAARQQSNEAREALKNIAKLVAKRQGQGLFTDGIYQEEVEMLGKKWANKQSGAERKFRRARKGVPRTGLNKEEQVQLTNLLSGREAPKASKAMLDLAADLRGILDEIWYAMRGAGFEIGYDRGYLPHIYNSEKIDANPTEFKKRAAEVYRLLFQRQIVESVNAEEQIADLNSLINGLRAATKALPKGQRAPDPRLSSSDEAIIATWRKERSKLQSMITKDVDADRITNQEEVVSDLTDEVMDVVGSAYADYSAEKWFIMKGVGNASMAAGFSPTANFLKGRTLPPETSHILSDFMEDSPLDLISGYTFQAARRSEYAKIFGVDGSKLENMLEAARAKGVSENDINTFRLLVNGAAGKVVSTATGMALLRSNLFAYGQMSLLTFAGFTSLAESAVTGLRTGRSRDSINALLWDIRALRRKNRRAIYELAGVIGLISPYMHETTMENRMGVDSQSIGRKTQKAVGRFHIITLLQPLTTHQRASKIPVAHSILLRWLRDSERGVRTVNSRLRDISQGGKGTFADGELNELGIAKEDRADLLKWMEGVNSIPVGDDLFGPDGQFHRAGELWSRAINRFVGETIQNPLKSDRAAMANHPDYSAMYGIMSFIDSFTQNVLIRNFIRGMEMKDEPGTFGSEIKRLTKNTPQAMWNTTLFAAPFATLFATHFLTTAVREALMNSDKWEELEEDDDPNSLMDWLIKRAFHRTGLTGRFDPIIQAYIGVKYDRDFTAITAGPYMASVLSNMMRVTKPLIGRNSMNTVTTENDALQAFYRLVIQPAGAAAISATGPASAILGNVSRFALFALSDYDSAEAFADYLVGEKGTKHPKGNAPWWEMKQYQGD